MIKLLDDTIELNESYFLRLLGFGTAASLKCQVTSQFLSKCQFVITQRRMV